MNPGVLPKIVLRVSALMLLHVAAAPARAEWVSAGLQGESVRTIVQCRSGVRIAAAGQGVRRSFDGGATWIPIADERFGDAFTAIAYADSNLVYISVESGTFRSADEGSTWQFLGDAIAGTYSLAIAPNLDLYASGGIGTLRSTDRGLSWSSIDQTPGSFGDGVAVDPDGRVFVKTIVDNLFRSTDHGASWDTLNPGPDYKAALEASPYSGTLLVGTQSFTTPGMLSVYRSTDHGDSWQRVMHRAGGMDAFRFLSNGGAVMAGDVVFYSSDDGLTWEPRNAGMPAGEQVREFVELDGVVYACMRDDGIYREDQILLPVTDPPGPYVSRLRVSAAPNRFQTRTTLRFELPATGRARIDVFDLNGPPPGAGSRRPVLRRGSLGHARGGITGARALLRDPVHRRGIGHRPARCRPLKPR